MLLFCKYLISENKNKLKRKRNNVSVKSEADNITIFKLKADRTPETQKPLSKME